MQACEFLLYIFLAIFIGTCDLFDICDGAITCPVRAVTLNTLVDVKCVCENAFVGEMCQFKGKGRPLSPTIQLHG